MSSIEIQNQHQVDERLQRLEKENQEKQTELERLRKDQEDLLELLTDQDMKLMSFKNRLKELGETIIEDGEESDNISVCSENET